MSRRSFYRQSTRQQTTYVNDIDEKVIHWSKEWVSPTISGTASTATQESQASSLNGVTVDLHDGDKKQTVTTLPFSVKMWVSHPELDEKDIPVKDSVEGDALLDLPQYMVIKRQPEAPTGGNNDLTAADIRGAVGGESIPGIASGYDNPSTEAKPEPEQVPTTLPTETAPTASIEPAPVASTEPVPGSASAPEAASTEPVPESAPTAPESVPEPTEPAPESVPEPTEPAEPAEPTVSEPTETAPSADVEVSHQEPADVEMTDAPAQDIPETNNNANTDAMDES